MIVDFDNMSHLTWQRFSKMRLTDPMRNNPAVKRVQEQLDSLGYEIEPDGIFGPVTEFTVKKFQSDHKLIVDGIVGRITRRTIRDRIDIYRERETHLPGRIHYLKNNKRPRLYYGERSWDEIDGVTLHQTGCKMPLRPAGWRNLNAHIGVTIGGQVIVCQDPTAKIWHAQKLSHTTIGIEIAGNFAGIEGHIGTIWEGGGPAALLTPNQIEGVNAAMEFISRSFRVNDQEWKYIHAHRQSSGSRTGDPGSAIWKEIALPWIKKLKLSDGGMNFKHGSGRPIPYQWNSEYKNEYWFDR